MSTILKALRRLEEENRAQSQRPLREEVTRSSSSVKSRRRGWPLLVAMLGLGVAAGAGAFVFWYLGGAPGPAQPTQLAAAGSSEPDAESSAAAPRSRKPRGARSARRRPSPLPAAPPSAASERELPAAALASKVEVMKRPPAQPRIAAGPQASEPVRSTRPRPMDPAEMPGRHEQPGSRARSASAPSIAAQREAPGPSGGALAPVGADASAPSPLATATPEQPREVDSEPVVVAVARRPEPGAERAAPEPQAESGLTPARDAERRAAAPKPTYTEAAAEASSGKPVKSAAVAPREREPASSEIARAEIPGLRVERTVWHPIAERRVALVEFERNAERREIREGDLVGPLVVSKIEPSGVVFVHEGIEVHRRIGE
jgi:hypothetical protein